MAATASNPAPKFNVPTFDLKTLMSIQKANLETALQAQKILSETARAIGKLHTSWLQEVAERSRTLVGADLVRKPEAVLAGAREVAERGFAVARQELDLGTRAQSEVINLFSKRAAANLDQVKALAAA